MDGKIVGCGISILHGIISWLGAIIVLPEYRKRGIGKEITCHLVSYCKSKGCTTQLLIASEMGEPLYTKIGFEISSTYTFYKNESAISTQHISNIRKVKPEDVQSIKEIDKEITGEERFVFLKKFISTGWIYESDKTKDVKGIYLPDIGSGLVIAKDANAGLTLMKLRLSLGKTSAIVPSKNTVACEYLISQGFQEYRTVPRMVLGNDVLWQPTMLYNRGAGYCG